MTTILRKPPDRTKDQRSQSSFVEPDNIRTPPSEAAPGPQIITTDTARQGPAGFPVLFVLIVSLAAAVVALGLYTVLWTSAL
ncbi:hypothetical protein [Phreatobacter stygius]|uniref:Uncharacterized protein n=1 Tax=Phreatobacter stygius TaxID=1940610 RepID=A0A4D7AXB9_9HYPH|nr:hypothetical protein [Phreatobacter stygius]QCI65849.1 hypothetical protein E8M01_17505 [Phreatobacter stygius]